ncbi:MAG: PEP-CTERM sorting domain-containing protein [Terriglobia bacterium]|jgi:hypothetical protein
MRTIREKARVWRAVAVAGAVFLTGLSLVPYASADGIVDPEVNLITAPDLQPPSGDLSAGTNNILDIFTSSLPSGFMLMPPGGILELQNDTGSPITTFSFMLVGTPDSADANGVLTCAFNQSNYTGCSASSSAGTGNPLMMPGQPPWTWSFTGGSVAAGADFELQFGSFNNKDTLSVSPVPEPATLTLFGAGLLALAGAAKRRLWSGIGKGE